MEKSPVYSRSVQRFFCSLLIYKYFIFEQRIKTWNYRVVTKWQWCKNEQFIPNFYLSSCLCNSFSLSCSSRYLIVLEGKYEKGNQFQSTQINCFWMYCKSNRQMYLWCLFVGRSVILMFLALNIFCAIVKSLVI